MNLIDQIEAKRAKLIEYSLMYGFTSPTTVKISQELDELLNLYRYILSNQK